MRLFGSFSGKKARSRIEERNNRIQEDRRHLLSERSNFFIREAYKTLRTNVNFAVPEEEGCKTLLITSSLQGEGKSITAANLAISYAQAEQRVLLIDCDLRRPNVARLLALNSPVGLSNLLVDPELEKQAILPSGVANLDVILSGIIPPNPSELLGSVRMQRLLERLRDRYDYIILDTPPVNMVADAMVLAPRSDGVLFVVRAGRSERDAVMFAVDQLEYSRVKILGFILNSVDMEKNAQYSKYRYRNYQRYSYGNYYDYGYGYGANRTNQRDEQRGMEKP